MQNREVSVELLNKILNYLASRPYIEVVEIIKEILAIPEVKPEVKSPIKPEAKEEKKISK